MKKNQPCCPVKGGSRGPWRFLVVSCLVCDKVTQCVLALTKRRGNTGVRCSGVRSTIQASQCFLSGFAWVPEGRRFLFWKHVSPSQDENPISMSHLHQSRKNWKYLCALCLPAILGVPFPSASLPEGL